MKNLYRVQFSWQGEIHSFHTQTISEEGAVRNALRKLAKKVGYDLKAVRDHVLDPNACRWEVTKIPRQ